MHDVLLGVHSSSSAATTALSQLTDKVNISYSGMDGHDNRMCRIKLWRIVSMIYFLLLVEESDPVAMVSFMSDAVQSTLQEAKQLKQKYILLTLVVLCRKWKATYLNTINLYTDCVKVRLSTVLLYQGLWLHSGMMRKHDWAVKSRTWGNKKRSRYWMMML